MSFSVDAVIRNTLQMNWIPMAGRIACTAATIEFATRMIANFNRADKISKIPGLSHILSTSAGNKAAGKLDRISGTKIAPGTLVNLFLFNLFSVCLGNLLRTNLQE